MVLIPEESCAEDEEGEDDNASPVEWREMETGNHNQLYEFDYVYDKYCQRMLFFDRMSAQHLNEAGFCIHTNSSARSVPKKLSSPLGCLSLKKIEEPEDEEEWLQQQGNDLHQDLETAYIAQMCLAWEALNCQYTQLTRKIMCYNENSTCYNHSAQQFQQFQVLLQRYIENEPFAKGLRPEIFARMRNSLPKLLHVPLIQGSEQNLAAEGSDIHVFAMDLIKIIENSILTFYLFLKTEKKKTSGVLNLFGSPNLIASPLQQIQSSLQKKEVKLKEMRKKKKGRKNKWWPITPEDVELLFGLIDIKVILRVLTMARISKAQLFWCQQKIDKLDLSDRKLERDASPVLFPC